MEQKLTKSGKYRRWCFTLNGYSELELKKMSEQIDGVKYMCFGKEIAPSTNMKHLQGWCYLVNPMSLKGVKNLISERAHWENCRADIESNDLYCTKDKDVTIWGELPNQGSRKDLKAIRNAIFQDGLTMDYVLDLCDNYQQLKYAEGLMKYQKCCKTRDVKIHWFWGKTGTGKTYTAIQECGDDYWISGRNLKWWQNYTGQKKVIIDDFRKDFCTFHELLRITDRYPYNIEYKGSSTWLKATDIYITSCYHPSEVYNTREDIEQLLRRIKSNGEIRKFGTEVEGNTIPQLPCVFTKDYEEEVINVDENDNDVYGIPVEQFI